MNKYDFLIDSAKEHQKLDEYRRGNTGCVEEDGIFRGCSVACTVHDYERYIGSEDVKDFDFYDHDYLSFILEVPRWVCHLQDSFFENISRKKLNTFNVDFITLIKENHHKNLDLVEPKFLLHVLQDMKNNVSEEFTQLLSVISKAEKAIQYWIDKGVLDKEKMNTAEEAFELPLGTRATRAKLAAACGAGWALKRALKRAAESAARASIMETSWAASWACGAEISEKSEKYDQYCDKFFELVREA